MRSGARPRALRPPTTERGVRSTESESEASARARLDLTRLSCSTVDDMEPQALGMTYWIEDPSVLASAETIRFTGRHAETYGTG